MDAKELEGRLRVFAIRVVTMCAALPGSRISKIIEDQLLRSSFSAAANYRAACKAISKRAFVSKLSIAFEESDESDESLFWTEVISELNLIPPVKMSAMIQEAKELSSILATARKTAQLNLKKS